MPATLPPLPDIDVEAVRSAAAALAPLGPEAAADGDRTIRTWRQVGAYYIAPETPVLLAALEPVGPLTTRSADRVTGTARALGTFAEQVEPLLARLRALHAAAGPVTPEEVARADAVLAELQAAEQACAAAIRALTGFDPRPAAVRVGEEVDKAKLAVTVGFVTLGRSAVFKETRFSDGSVLLTVVDAGELGPEGSLGEMVKLGAGVTIENGSTWKFRTPEEAAALRQQLDAYVAQQRAVLYDDTGGAATGVAIFGGVPAPRPPDLVVTEAEVAGSVAGSVKTDLVNAGATVEGKLKETLIRDVAAGTTTTVRSREGSLAADGSVTPFGFGPSEGLTATGKIASTAAVTRDATGRITRVLLTATGTSEVTHAENVASPEPGTPGRHRADPSLDPTGTIKDEAKGARATVTTTTLDVTDANRAAVEAWVAAGQPDGGPAGDPRLHYPDTAVPGDAFQNALHQGAKVSRVTYDDATEVRGIEAKIKAGWELGLEVTSEGTTTRAGQGSYLGAPGPDGTRAPVPLPTG